MMASGAAKSPSPTAPADRSPLLSIVDVTKRFGGVVALDGVSFDVATGECLGVIGPNGAGKSTLLSLVSGAQRPSSGSVVFKGHPIERMRPYAVPRVGIGRAHQVPRPFRRMTVRENLLVASHSAGGVAVHRDDRSREVLEVCGRVHRADRPAGSRGLLDLTRLEVARALALGPDLLLLDEVAAGLVGEEVDEVTTLIRGLHERGTTIMLVEHVQALVHALASRVVVLDWGRKIAEGTPAEVAADPEVIRIYFGTGGAGSDEPDAAPARSRPGAGTAPLVSTEALSVRYGRLPALHSVDVELYEGEIVAVLGANGAGKTSVARAIAGLTPVAGGRIRFAGKDITAMRAHERTRLGIALCFEGRRLFTSLSVRENLELAAAYGARSRGGPGERLQRVFDLFPILEERSKSGAGELSGGQQQMLAIGRALMTEARLVLLDELSLGLAPQVVDEAYGAVRRLRDWGVSVMLIEQNVHRSLAVAERVYVLERGHVRAVGTPAEVSRDETLMRAYFGAAAGPAARAPVGPPPAAPDGLAG